jgi:cold shock CspA family protein
MGRGNIMKTGKIATYNQDKGYGFIRLADKKLAHIFFHITCFLCDPQKDLAVQFEIIENEKGLTAINVDILGNIPGIQSLAGEKAGA